MTSTTMSKKIEYTISDEESMTDVYVHVAVDAQDSIPIGIGVDNPDSLGWMSMHTAEGVVEALQQAIDTYKQGIRPVGQPTTDNAPLQIEHANYDDIQHAVQFSAPEWNSFALTAAEDQAEVVTFLYQGEYDSYPRQRKVRVMQVVGDLLIADDLEDDDQVKNFRLDRIKSHALIVDEEG